MHRALALAALLLASTPTFADQPFAASARVSDGELATMRGGFALPSGIDVALAVQMDVAIDGALVLRTVFRADQGAPTLAVYAPAPGQTGPRFTAPPPIAGANAPTNWTVIVDRAAGITTLQPSQSSPPAVAVSSVGDPSVGMPPAGLSPLNIRVGGPAVQTMAGPVQLIPLAQGTRITLGDPGAMSTQVTQLVGQAFLNAVNNSANNRTIDTATSLNVNLAGATATQVATSALRVQDIASDVATRLVR